MIITCPRCTTAYDVDPAAFGAADRSVQCSHCGLEWLQRTAATSKPAPAVAGPPAGRPSRAPAEPTTAPPPPRARAPAVGRENAADAVRPAAAPAEPAPETNRPETNRPETNRLAPTTPVPATDRTADSVVAAVPAVTAPTEPEEAVSLPRPDIGAKTAERKPKRPSRPGIAAAVIATLLGVAAIAVLARQSIVEVFPDAAAWYSQVGFVDVAPGAGLDIRDVSSSRDDTAAGEVLVVAGAVINTAEGQRTVPPIRVGLYDGDDHELQVVVVPPVKAALGPGEQMSFTARLEKPSPEARRVKVTFEP
jgi:predicted Zn finger-like uncharacterized protein